MRISESPASDMAIVEHLWYFPHAVPNAMLFPVYMITLALASTAKYYISAFLTVGQLFERITSFA